MSVHRFYYLLFFYLPFAAASQQRTATSQLDTTAILIGDQVKLYLELRVQAQDNVQWPSLNDTLTDKIEIVEKSKLDTVFDKDDITLKTYSQLLTITSFDSGYFPVPPFKFIVNQDTLETEPLLLEVHTVSVDTAQNIADIKGPLDMEYSLLDWLKEHWLWVVGVLAAIALVFGIIYWLKKKKPAPVVREIPKPKIPAHIIAFRKLDELQEKKLWQNDRVKDYHIELSDILREYLENRYYVQALEQTTWEIMQSLKKIDCDEENKSRLRQLLTLSDLVKFAKEKPLSVENETCLSDAYQFVKATVSSVFTNGQYQSENPVIGSQKPVNRSQ